MPGVALNRSLPIEAGKRGIVKGTNQLEAARCVNAIPSSFPGRKSKRAFSVIGTAGGGEG